MAQLMKGQKWRDRRHKMTYPAWVEIKHDEIRCHVIVDIEKRTVQYLSYAEKPLHNLSRFDAEWLALADENGVLEFDCGFEANGTYNDSYRYVRSSKGLPEDLKDAPCMFYLFDLPAMSGVEFAKRTHARHVVQVQALTHDLPLAIPKGSWAHEEKSVEEMFTVARQRGYEGLMVKSLGHTYERGKRTDGWLKVKAEEDEDGIIEGFTEAISEDGKPLGRVGSVSIRMPDNSFAAPHGVAHELGKHMWENPDQYIGRWATFHFMERDRQGGYRHPTWFRLREDK